MIDKLEKLLDKAHNIGIKLPYFRDPIKGTPSVSLTLLMISFALYILTLVNKIAGVFGNVEGTFELLVLTSALYFGRSFSGKATTNSDKQE